MSKKYLYYFSEGNDAFGGDKVTMKNTLGGKGAGLAEMTAAGMPVPQGFTITTDACTQYYADGRQINDEITADIFEHLKGLEEITGKKFGDNQNPLLVSVRSGARQRTDHSRAGAALHGNGHIGDRTGADEQKCHVAAGSGSQSEADRAGCRRQKRNDDMDQQQSGRGNCERGWHGNGGGRR